MNQLSDNPSINIAECVRHWSTVSPNKLAVVDGDTRLTYQDLNQIVCSICKHLVHAAIGRGSCVVILLPNSWEMVVTALAALRCGAIILPINSLYLDSEIETILAEAQPDAIFASSDKLAIISPLIGKLEKLRLCVTNANDVPQWLAFDTLTDQCLSNRDELSYSQSETVLSPPEDASALWLYSSGSTGGSKKISRAAANLMHEAKSLQAALLTSCDDVFLCAVPLAHAHGFGNALIAAFLVGGTLILHRKFDRRLFLKTIESERVSIVPGSPFMYKVAAETKMDQSPDLSSVRYWISAGAPLPERTFIQCRDRFNIAIRQLYGTTETGAVSVNTSSNVEETWYTVGAPIGSVEVGIFDQEGNQVQNNSEGRIGVRSPSMFDQYEVPELNENAFTNGFFFAGDLGYRLDSGEIVITGRETKFINIAGNKVDPAEVETLIRKHPKVSEVVVVGKQDDHAEIVKAVIVSKSPCTAEEIVNHCQGKIAEYKIPRSIEFMDELPKSPLGKILKKYLR